MVIKTKFRFSYENQIKEVVIKHNGDILFAAYAALEGCYKPSVIFDTHNNKLIAVLQHGNELEIAISSRKLPNR